MIQFSSLSTAASASGLSSRDVTGYLIDLAVVITGVTAAFILNSWWERRRHKQLEQKYYRSFGKDVGSDLKLLAEVIELNRAKKDRAAGFVESIRKDGQTVDSSMKIIQDTLTIVPFKPIRTTYNSLVSSGDLNAMGNFEFKADLVKLYDGYEETASKERWLDDFISRFAMPFIYENLDLTTTTIPDPHLIRSSRFKNLVLGYYALLNQNLEACETAERTGMEFMARLKKRMK
jgi:hypothetical protein